MRVYGKNNFRKVRIYVDYSPAGWTAMSPDIDRVLGEGESFHLVLDDFFDKVSVSQGSFDEQGDTPRAPFVDMRTPLIRTDILPEHLSKFRKACGLSLKDMSAKTGLSLSQIKNIELDIRREPFSNATIYLNALANAANLAVVSIDLDNYTA